jgi:hypothetical protein
MMDHGVEATAPSGRPREKAKPALVVASALKPKEARSLVVPTSHGIRDDEGGEMQVAKDLALVHGGSSIMSGSCGKSIAAVRVGQTNAVGSEAFGVVC